MREDLRYLVGGSLRAGEGERGGRGVDFGVPVLCPSEQGERIGDQRLRAREGGG